jgi:hypothetical protein
MCGLSLGRTRDRVTRSCLRPIAATEVMVGSSSAYQRAYPPTIRVAPTIARRLLFRIGVSIPSWPWKVVTEPIRLAADIIRWVPPASLRRASALQRANPGDLHKRIEVAKRREHPDVLYERKMLQAVTFARARSASGLCYRFRIKSGLAKLGLG